MSDLSGSMAGVIGRIRERGVTPPGFVDPMAEREQRQAIYSLAVDLGPRYSPERTALSAYRIYHKNQQAIVDRVDAIGANPTKLVEAGRGVIFFGTVGTGKDHLLASILYGAARLGIACRWVNGQEVFGQFRDRMDTGHADESHFRELCKPTVLAISDPTPPVGRTGDWDAGNLYRLIDRRYRAMKSTWLTINASSAEDADAKLSEPVFDRLRDGAEMLGCFWPSWRERSK